jgi:GTP pyrophosphokinase
MYQKGLKIFEDNCKDRFIDFEEACLLLDSLTILNHFDVSNKKDLFILIGQKTISSASVLIKLYDQNRTVEEQIDSLNKRGYAVKRSKAKGDIAVGGASSGIKIEPAVCCKPIPGDDIVGFITRGSGIKAHRKDCPNVIRETKRLIDVKWNMVSEKNTYPVDLEVLSYDRNNLLVDLMGLISTINIRIDSLSARSHYENKTATLSCTVYVNNKDSLNILISKIKSIHGIISINRVCR